MASHQICQDGVLNPSSPEMWTMFHFGDNFQADPSQGTLGLSIPVFHYSDERFEIPIELCYNTAGGYRPGMQAGPFGLGWTLSCLGAITREIRGIADEEGVVSTDMYSFRNKFHHYDDSNLSVPTVFGWGSVYDSTYVSYAFPGNYSHDVRHGYFRDFTFTGKTGVEYMPMWSHVGSYDYDRASFETLPDVFHFSFLGRSGSFLLQPGKTVVVFGTSDSPCNYNISAELTRSVNGFESFAIKTEDNYVYTFGGTLSSVERATSSDGLSSTEDVSIASSWRLTSISAPDGRTVTFEYGSGMTTRTLTPTHTYDLPDYYSTYIDINEYEPASDEFRNVLFIQDTPTCSEVQSRLLTRILISGRAEILFTYGAAGCEQGADGTSAKKLENVTVRSLQSNSTIRSANLSYHLSGTAAESPYSSSGTGVTFLSSVSVPGHGKWSMTYDSETEPFPAMSTRAIDWMGYYNGNASQDAVGSLFCPSISTVSNPDSRSWMLDLRKGDLASGRMGMLSSICYPTGGSSNFEYELNEYSTDLGYPRAIPSGHAPGYGIRIACIKNRDADGRLCGSRSFTYASPDGRSSGTLLWRPLLYSHYKMKSLYFDFITRTTLSTSDSSPYSRGVFIEYDRVVETVQGGPGTVGMSVTERLYDSHNAAGCRECTENWTDGYEFNYPGAWYFRLGGSEDSVTYSARQDFNTWLQSRRGGRLLQETEYSDDLYHPVRRASYNYGSYLQSSTPLRYTDMQLGHLLDYCYPLEDPWLGQVTVTEFSPDGSEMLASTTTNTLDSNFRLASETETASSGESVVTYYEWLDACPALLSRLLVARDGVLAEGVRRTYTSVNGHPLLFVPAIIQSADTGGSPNSPVWRTEQSCPVWSSGGLPLEILDKGGQPSALVWAYGGMYLAAKVIGKHFSELVSADSSLQGGVLSGNLTSQTESLLRNMPTARVTTYRWEPLVGLVQAGSESGRTAGYGYDAGGRLSSVQNGSGSVVATYEYSIMSDSDN